MPYRFSYQLLDRWPPLAWCAEIRRADNVIDVTHGVGVELLPNGFCEAVWDGDFEQGRIDQTDIIFGSGAVQVQEDILFVSSGSTVDRLHWWSGPNSTFVSNSLACLLAQIDATVAATYDAYFPFFESIIRGIDRYETELSTSRGGVQLTYFRNLRWDGERLRVVDKPIPQRDFQSFASYHNFLTDSFARLGANLAAPQRTYKLQPLATISTGYDSSASAAVARHAGLEETISVARGRGDVEDDGSVIARQLGLSPIVVQRGESATANANIPLFIASDAKGEDIYFAGSQQHLRGRFLVTGYSGSRVWDTSKASYEGLRRGDQSGLSHAEARLHFGYIHCPAPFLGGLQEADIRAIGRAEEMQPWSVDSDYNRPVCRRILEEAGVQREAFGQGKKAASVLLFDRRTFLPNELAADYFRWLQHHDLRKNSFSGRVHRSMDAVPRALLRGLQSIDPNGQLPVLRRLSDEGRLQKYAFHEPLFDHLFPWALEKTMERYQVGINSRCDAKLIPSSTTVGEA